MCYMSQQVFSAKNLPRELQEKPYPTRIPNYLWNSGLNLIFDCTELYPP